MFRRRLIGDSGMVTAEFAVALIPAALIAVAMVWLVTVLGLVLRCHDVAGEVARQSARGDLAAVQTAEDGAPAGTSVRVTTESGTTQVEVKLVAKVWADWLPSIPIQANATAKTEAGR